VVCSFNELTIPDTVLLVSKFLAHYYEIYLINLRIIYIMLINTQNILSIVRSNTFMQLISYVILSILHLSLQHNQGRI
jgi:hypothetical protein